MWAEECDFRPHTPHTTRRGQTWFNVVRRVCAFRFADGRSCGAAPLRDSAYCLFHDPAHAEAVTEARKVVGQRSRKEATLATVYDIEDITSDAGIRRLAQIAVADL